MRHILLFESFTQEEDLDFLDNVKDILLEYAEKYDLVETGTGHKIPDDYDYWDKFHNHNGYLQCTLIREFSTLNDNCIEVIISIKDENSVKEFFDSGDDKNLLKRLKNFGYKPELIRSTSNINYALYYQFYIYR